MNDRFGHVNALFNSVAIVSGFLTVNFLKKNEITIPSLQYRKAKELTVRLYGFCENAFNLKVLIP